MTDQLTIAEIRSILAIVAASDYTSETGEIRRKLESMRDALDVKRHASERTIAEWETVDAKLRAGWRGYTPE